MHELILLTGINGFIAKHVALNLLKHGYRIRGTIRTPDHADAVRKTLQAHGADTSGLSFVEVDLNEDDGWEEAASGCEYVQHVASPFPIEQPRDREALVPEAQKGALRVLDAAREAGIRRVVFTSSMVAMMHRPDRPEVMPVTESDWTDPEWKSLSAYIVSKTRAEKAAWDWAEQHGWKERLTMVNPGFVLGPALDSRTNTSLNVIQLLMEGAYPAVPPVSYPIIDVRDLAELYEKAMTVPEAGGRRLIGSSSTSLSMSEMGSILRKAFPDRAKKIPTAELPGFLVRFLSNFDRTLKSVTADLGFVPRADSAYVTELTGVRFRPAMEAVQAAGQSLVSHGIVK